MSLRASLVYAANAGAPNPKAAATASAAHTTHVHRMTRKHWIVPSFSAAIMFTHRPSPAAGLHHQVIVIPEADLLPRGKGEQDPVDPGDDQFDPVGQADAERLAGVRAGGPLFAVLRDVEDGHGGRPERSPWAGPATPERLEGGALAGPAGVFPLRARGL